jgi:RNA polymerase subunit RPABC4/transcription elongation factor Spt4
MLFETREQVFERVVNLEKPLCPHCGKEMSLWEVPAVAVDDGLGWGEPFLFICYNDECSLYSEGWNDIQERYGRTASYRCLCYPASGKFECMPVYGPDGGKGQIIDDEALAEQERIRERTETGMRILAECRVAEDHVRVMRIVLDASETVRVRVHAAELLADIGAVETVEPLRSRKFGNEVLRKKVEAAIHAIHARNYTRECPFCAEIVKERAKICKHCGQDIGNA